MSSNRKTWTYTDDPFILRNRVNALNRELDQKEELLASYKATNEQQLKARIKDKRLTMDVGAKLNELVDWYDKRLAALAPPD